MTTGYKFNFKVILASDKPVVNFSTGVYKTYRAHFKIPCFIFVRDTVSYLVLLALHLAIIFAVLSLEGVSCPCSCHFLQFMLLSVFLATRKVTIF